MKSQARIPSAPKTASLKTRGDIGTAGIGLAVGYFGDIVLAHFFPQFGVPAGAASVYFSSAAVGMKQVVQSVLERRRIKRDAAATEEASRRSSERQTKLILETLRNCASQSASAEIQQKLEMAEELFRSDRKFHEAGILTDEQWLKSIQDAVAVIRENGCRAS